MAGCGLCQIWIPGSSSRHKPGTGGCPRSCASTSLKRFLSVQYNNNVTVLKLGRPDLQLSPKLRACLYGQCLRDVVVSRLSWMFCSSYQTSSCRALDAARAKGLFSCQPSQLGPSPDYPQSERVQSTAESLVGTCFFRGNAQTAGYSVHVQSILTEGIQPLSFIGWRSKMQACAGNPVFDHLPAPRIIAMDLRLVCILYVFVYFLHYIDDACTVQYN